MRTYGWPQFAMQHGLTNQLAKLEDAELEYERITSTKLSDVHKMSVLLRCISGPLKQYTNLAVVEGTSYLNLVAMVKRWESSQTKWTVPINNMYQLGSASSGHDTSGSTWCRTKVARKASTKESSQKEKVSAQTKAKEAKARPSLMVNRKENRAKAKCILAKEKAITATQTPTV